MSLIAKDSGNFTPAPEGLWPAVCVDVVDMGIVKQEWQGKVRQAHKCRLVWEISELMEDGRRFIVGKRYTVSLHLKSTLHKDLKSWRGKAFSKEELAGFDVEKVLGVPCRLMIMHEEKEGKIYANITAITKADRATAIAPAGTYVRVKDREQVQQQVPGTGTMSNGNDPELIDPFAGQPTDDGDPFSDDVKYETGESIPF